MSGPSSGDVRPETEGKDAGDRAAVVEWFQHQVHAAEASGRCPRELWTPWDLRGLASRHLASGLGEARP